VSINYCTLASSTVDAFCSPRRGVILSRLIAELHPPVVQGGGNPRVLRDTFGDQYLRPRPQVQQRPHYEIDDRDPMKYEQPFVSVTVTLFGDSRTETQDVTAQVDIVSVTNLEFGTDAEISVNTSEFSFD
jgi:hypothetical protein